MCFALKVMTNRTCFVKTLSCDELVHCRLFYIICAVKNKEKVKYSFI